MPESRKLGTALGLLAGFGGTNASLIVRNLLNLRQNDFTRVPRPARQEPRRLTLDELRQRTAAPRSRPPIDPIAAESIANAFGLVRRGQISPFFEDPFDTRSRR